MVTEHEGRPYAGATELWSSIWHGPRAKKWGQLHAGRASFEDHFCHEFRAQIELGRSGLMGHIAFTFQYNSGLKPNFSEDQSCHKICARICFKKWPVWSAWAMKALMTRTASQTSGCCVLSPESNARKVAKIVMADQRELTGMAGNKTSPQGGAGRAKKKLARLYHICSEILSSRRAKEWPRCWIALPNAVRHTRLGKPLPEKGTRHWCHFALPFKLIRVISFSCCLCCQEIAVAW